MSRLFDAWISGSWRTHAYGAMVMLTWVWFYGNALVLYQECSQECSLGWHLLRLCIFGLMALLWPMWLIPYTLVFVLLPRL